MQAFRTVFPYDFVVMLGDNVYDGGTPDDYRRKFELPYKPLLDDEVEFYATIGNHDAANQPFYEPFNMDGRRYYTFKADQSLLARLTDADVQFFMIDTETLDRTQVAWIDREMGRSDARWKIPAFHRPIYTSGRYATPARLFRSMLEPVFLRHDVRLALSGHEHFYERIRPAAGHYLLHLRRGRVAARRGHPPYAAYRRRLRHRLSLHALRGDARRAVLPGNQPYRPLGGFGLDQAGHGPAVRI